MIPNKIHYCWFGGKELPADVKRCIESWKKYMPDAEIIRWDENNYDVNWLPYSEEAYEKKKFAFVSDVARLKIIYDEGGIYLDVDVELLKSFEQLRNCNMFCGFQTEAADGKFYINTGLGFGARKSNVLVKKMLDDYKNTHFVLSSGEMDLTSCPIRNSKVLEKEGFLLNNTRQEMAEGTVFPSDYFCPMDEKSGRINYSSNTYSIHHFSASWLSLGGLIKKKVRMLIGIERWNGIKRLLKRGE